MEQLINNMLTNVQVPQTAPAAKKNEAAPDKDGFQKLLEQKQSPETQAAPRQEKTETPAKQPQETAQKAQESQTPQQVQSAPKDEKELEEQMVLAAMAMLQNPVVPMEETAQRAVEVTGGAMDQVAALAAPESSLAPEDQTFVPETERAVEPRVENGESQTPEYQAMAEEIPQAVEAPERAESAREGTVEVKTETAAHPQAKAAEEKSEEMPELQDAQAETPVFENVKAVPVKVGEAPAARESSEAQNIGEQIGAKMVEVVSVTGESDGQSITVYLNPENLGRVHVEISLSKDGTLHVALNAENSRTQNLLSRNSESLAAILGKYAQEEVRVEVPRQEESQRQDLYQQQQEHHRQQRQQERRSQPGDSENFLQQLRLGLIPMDEE